MPQIGFDLPPGGGPIQTQGDISGLEIIAFDKNVSQRGDK